MRVLIIGHACSSRQGSEAAGTWNWAWYLSLRHEVSVLAFPHDRDAVEEFLSSNPNPNLKFHWITPNGSLGKYSRDRGVQSPWLYLSWQALAYQKAMDLQKEIGFDVVHHVSYGSVSAPPPVQRLGIPFVWGPLGGAQRT